MQSETFHRWARGLAAGVVALAIAAPAARAGHQDLGTRCALYLSGHGSRAACLQDIRSNSESSTLTVAGASGFDWADFGVGVATTVILIVLASGLMVAARHRTPTRRAKAQPFLDA